MLSHPMEFELASEKDIWSHVNVNVASVPAMSKLVLPGMLSRGRGAVVNLASIAGFHPIPLMGIYSATKVTAFLCQDLAFTQSRLRILPFLNVFILSFVELDLVFIHNGLKILLFHSVLP